MRLWTSNDPDARHFRQNIRFFNGHFSFTTLYCHLDRDTTDIERMVFTPFEHMVKYITTYTHLVIV
uniref:Uncharacterized protein n=1 Tax=Aegilops tauschii subsp. strangulata TaxID=200361 RepID=A0A452Z7E9_AEGTS